MKNYEDRVLIKLQRQYSEHEAVALLSKKLKEAYTKIGQLESEIHHLKHVITMSGEAKEARRQAKIQAQKDDLFLKLRNKNKALIKKYKELIKLRDKLIAASNSSSTSPE